MFNKKTALVQVDFLIVFISFRVDFNKKKHLILCYGRRFKDNFFKEPALLPAKKKEKKFDTKLKVFFHSLLI